MKKFNFIRMILILTFTCSCTFAESKMILEYKDIQFPKVVESDSDGVKSIAISGLAFHSSLAVGKIESKANDSIMTVYIYLVPARQGLSGSFDYTIAIPSSINKVLFGEQKTVIWERQ